MVAVHYVYLIALTCLLLLSRGDALLTPGGSMCEWSEAGFLNASLAAGDTRCSQLRVTNRGWQQVRGMRDQERADTLRRLLANSEVTLRGIKKMEEKMTKYTAQIQRDLDALPPPPVSKKQIPRPTDLEVMQAFAKVARDFGRVPILTSSTPKIDGCTFYIRLDFETGNSTGYIDCDPEPRPTSPDSEQIHWWRKIATIFRSALDGAHRFVTYPLKYE